MKRLFLILAALPAFGQNPPQAPFCQQINCYVASTGNVSLSSAATAATIQQPAAAPYNKMIGVQATVYCSVACVVTRSYGGTAASTTAGTVVPSYYLPNGTMPIYLLLFTASNVSGGTTYDVSNLGAGETRRFDLSDLLFGTIPNQNYTISVGSITGTANITFYLGLR